MVLVVSFFGCCGSARENRWYDHSLLFSLLFSMLGSYFTLVLLIVLGLAACGIIAFAGFWRTDDLVQKGECFNSQTNASAWDKADNSTKVWIYDHFECCGFVEPNWNDTLCIDVQKKFPNATISGCRDALVRVQVFLPYNDQENWMLQHLTVVEIVAVVFGVVLIVGLTLTCCLFCAIPSQAKLEKKERKKLLKQAKHMNHDNYQSVTVQTRP